MQFHDRGLAVLAIQHRYPTHEPLGLGRFAALQGGGFMQMLQALFHSRTSGHEHAVYITRPRPLSPCCSMACRGKRMRSTHRPGSRLLTKRWVFRLQVLTRLARALPCTIPTVPKACGVHVIGCDVGNAKRLGDEKAKFNRTKLTNKRGINLIHARNCRPILEIWTWR